MTPDALAGWRKSPAFGSLVYEERHRVQSSRKAGIMAPAVQSLPEYSAVSSEAGGPRSRTGRGRA